MTDLDLLFLVLGIIYILECAWWTKRGSIAFRTWLGLRWQDVYPGRLLGNQRGGLLFSHPLPPLGTLLTGNPLPLSVSAEAVLSYIPPSLDPATRAQQPANLFLFDQIKTIDAKGKKVRINGQLLLGASSAPFAAYLVETLKAIKETPSAKRAGQIEKLVEAAFDTKTIKARLAQFRDETAQLRFTANALFFYLFLAVPAVIWRIGLTGTWIWLLVGLLLLTSSIAFFFHRAHKLLFPSAEDERFTNFLIVLLSPASAIRARDLIARPLLERFHPLAIARVLCLDTTFGRMAEGFLRELRYPALPLCPRPEPAAQAAERYARDLSRKALEGFLRRNSLDPDKLLSVPQPSDETCRSFCPRCQTQFTAARGTCQDCGGVELIPFASEPRPSEPVVPK
jgi:hypothetical protein